MTVRHNRASATDAPRVSYADPMAEPTVDQAVERALRAQDDKIAAIRALATARQALADVKDTATRKMADLERENAELISTAERDDVRLYNAATKAGWTATELRKIGFDTPTKTRRTTRKRTATNAQEDLPKA